MTTSRSRHRGACVAIAAALAALAMGSTALGDESDSRRGAPPASLANGWGEMHIPYRVGSGRFCEVAAEGTSIRPDVVNRLVFLDAGDAQGLIAELRARDAELVAEAPAELTGDFAAVAQAAGHLYAVMEANGFDLQQVPEEVLMSLSAPAIRSAFDRTTTYLKEACDVDIWSVLSTV